MKKKYYRIIYKDDNDRVEYNCLFNINLYDLSYEAFWLNVYFRDNNLMSSWNLKDDFVMSIPIHRIIRVVTYEMDDQEALERRANG